MIIVKIDPVEDDTLLINECVKEFRDRGDYLSNKGWIDEAKTNYRIAEWLDQLISFKTTFRKIEKAHFDILSGMITLPAAETDNIFKDKEVREDFIRKSIASGLKDLLAENLSLEKVDHSSGMMLDTYRGYICMMRRDKGGC